MSAITKDAVLSLAQASFETSSKDKNFADWGGEALANNAYKVFRREIGTGLTKPEDGYNILTDNIARLQFLREVQLADSKASQTLDEFRSTAAALLAMEEQRGMDAITQGAKERALFQLLTTVAEAIPAAAARMEAAANRTEAATNKMDAAATKMESVDGHLTELQKHAVETKKNTSIYIFIGLGIIVDMVGNACYERVVKPMFNHANDSQKPPAILQTTNDEWQPKAPSSYYRSTSSQVNNVLNVGSATNQWKTLTLVP